MRERRCPVSSALVVGGAVGRDVRPAAHLLSFCFAKKKVGQEKGDPTGRVPCASLRGSLRCSALGRRCGTRFALRAPLKQPQRVSLRKRACFAARPPHALRFSARPEGRGTSTRAIAALGLGFLLPLPHAGEGRGEGGVCFTPSGCAEERSGRGEPEQRSMLRPRYLTRWRCLNGAPKARSEFDSAPRPRAPQVARSEAKGRSQWGRLSFAYFSLARQRKVGAPPGAIPGQQHIQHHSPLLHPSFQRGEGVTSPGHRP